MLWSYLREGDEDGWALNSRYLWVISVCFSTLLGDIDDIIIGLIGDILYEYIDIGFAFAYDN